MTELRYKLANLREQWEAEKHGVGNVARDSQPSSTRSSCEYNQLSTAIKEKQAAG